MHLGCFWLHCWRLFAAFLESFLTEQAQATACACDDQKWNTEDDKKQVEHQKLKNRQLERTGPQMTVTIFDHVFDHEWNSFRRTLLFVFQDGGRQASVAWEARIGEYSFDVGDQFIDLELGNVHTGCRILWSKLLPRFQAGQWLSGKRWPVWNDKQIRPDCSVRRVWWTDGRLDGPGDRSVGSTARSSHSQIHCTLYRSSASKHIGSSYDRTLRKIHPLSNPVSSRNNSRTILTPRHLSNLSRTPPGRLGDLSPAARGY